MANSATKNQLNLFVTPEVDKRFRDAAFAGGHGRRPSPFLEVLCDLHDGNLPAVSKAIDRALAANPELLADPQQRAVAAEITHKLAKAAGRVPVQPS